ncbi:MAG: Trk system potassium transporter TrkA [Spirochaetaceae bacterium]|jgi:trk system potassium uptake protein TrkA|nr:Trk system potassium transporter TrkA [Spirochaetaceae bacterium]
MRIVIVGAGLVGLQLAQYLIQEKHNVSLIESNEERGRYASNRLDCLVLHDEGNSLRVLEKAGIAKADALVCVTGSDEVNMIICGLAASRNPKLLKIARVRNDDYARLNKTSGRVLGIDHFVHPDVEASEAALNAIEHGARGDILAFAGTPYQLGSVTITPGSVFDGLVVKDYRKAAPGESLITLVERPGGIILPSGATVLARGDRIHILAREKELGRIFGLAGRTEQPLRNIGIAGGGRLGSLIAEGLLTKAGRSKPSLFSFFKTLVFKRNFRVVIIERDYHLCKELAARFPEALILNDDISEESFTTEEQLDKLDLIVTTTDKQELNIITAVYLKSRGVDRAVAMVTGPGYAAIARRLGVDVVIPMKTVIVDSILSRLMGGGVKEVRRLGDGGVDVMQVEIRKDAPVADAPISAFRLSAGGLLMLVNRGGDSFIPTGDYVFKAGDSLVLIAKTGSRGEIERYFGAAE